MLHDIAVKILDHLNDCGLDTQQIDFKQIIDEQAGALQKPAVNISVNTGQYQKATMGSDYLARPVYSLFVMVQDLTSEPVRRGRISDLIDSIIKCLLYQDFGLCLETKLRPISFSNVTSEGFSNAGYLVFQIDFTCSYIVEKQDLDGAGDKLISIINKYFLTKPEDDGIADFEGNVYFFIYDGGNAYSDNFNREFDGGFAASIQNFVINGGNAYTEHN